MNDPFLPKQPPSPMPVIGEQKSHPARWLLGVFLSLSVLFGFLAWYAIDQYNDLQASDERVDAEWSLVLTQYMRRADLVPNLVAVVKSYASHESSLFTEIAETRSRVASISASMENSKDPRALELFLEAQKQLSVPLSRLLMVAENYPALLASDLYRDLMVQLEGTENRIAYSRMRYVQSIANFNLNIRRFPVNLFASHAGYKPRPKFSAENEWIIKNAPRIDLK